MRRILALFLMLTLFASAVICGCGHEARADIGAEASHHHDGGDADHHHGKGGSVSPDCHKADMQLPAHTGVAKPDLKSSLHFDFAFVNDQTVPRLDRANNRGIRGPPPWDDLSHAQPSILLTTQRLRI
jgi:hypothetical protein